MTEIDTISLIELSEMAKKMYSGLVKAVVDLEIGSMVVDVEMHVDGEQLLLEKSSKQKDLWGINLYPDKYDTKEFVEFDSMINIRPSQQNNSRTI
jgi:hypothetical protein